ncbi:hypothetical protein [Kribbella sp. NPDC055071]
MRTIRRITAVAGLVAAAASGGATVADAHGTSAIRVQSEGEVACGYDYDACVTQWYDYVLVKNYIVSKIYYRGGGYHFYWWN